MGHEPAYVGYLKEPREINIGKDNNSNFVDIYARPEEYFLSGVVDEGGIIGSLKN
ncbi:hypothetical protein QT397_09110 [Microbulbifer sp. MKSA007]|nr:hypothetical protein QT397_09110 [Microbulbifer sp. MKSA007]